MLQRFSRIMPWMVMIPLFLSGMPALAETSPQMSLDDAYRMALTENEEVRISRELLLQAEKDIDVAASGLYPQFSANGAYTRRKDLTFSTGLTEGGAGAFSSPDEYGTLTFQLDQHIYQWGKLWSARQAAAYAYESSSFRHIRQVQAILFQVSTRYYEVLLSRRRIEIAENALKLAQEQLARAEARFDVGVVTRTDVLRAKVQVAQSQEDLERTRNQYDIAKERLALEMGIETVPGSLVEPVERTFRDVPMKELYEKAVDNRRDYRQYEERLKAAAERVKTERADFFPRLSASGEYTRTDEDSLFYGEPDDWRASLVVSYPLFTGWKNSAELAQAKSGESQAQFALNRLKKEIRTEVRSVYLDILTQQKVIDQLEGQVGSARQNYEQVTAQFEEGLLTAVDQVDAFTALNEAENRLALAYYTYQMDLIRLDLAVGTFQEDLLAEALGERNQASGVRR